MAPKKDDRLALPALGEYYDDILTIDAWINNRTKPQQAQGLLCYKLQEREARIRERVEYLAKKRGIDSETLWLQILKGEAERLSPEDLKILQSEESADD
ncbi:MAG: hypothetical protein F6K32_24025 [Desertifilum sp. SIO1I2]|nr:hypothetical protein [Desertifilum sp. SIO1I2]